MWSVLWVLCSPPEELALEAVGCAPAAVLTAAAVWLPTSGEEGGDAAGLLEQLC